MAQVAIAAVGAAIGGAVIPGTFLGLSGAAIGWSVGSLLGSSFQTIKNVGPLSSDLSAPKLQYGSPIPRGYGRHRYPGTPIWQSTKRAIANTVSEGGKGGPSVENTTYTYEVDVLYMVKIENPLAIAVTRVWINRRLVFSALAESDAETLSASASTEAWQAMTLYDGNSAQMPWPIYEADVGTEEATAYRRRTTIAIEGLNLGASDQLPLVEFEVITAGTPGEIEAVTLLQSRFNGDDATDESVYECPYTILGTGLVSGDEFISEPDIANESQIVWNQPFENHFARPATRGLTLELKSRLTSYAIDTAHLIGRIEWTGGTPFQISCYWVNGFIGFGDTTDGLYEADLYDPGGDEAKITIGIRPGAVSQVDFYVNNVKVVERNIPIGDLEDADGAVRLGSAASGGTILYSISEVRLREGFLIEDGYTYPVPMPGPDAGMATWTPDAVDLADIVTNECELAGLDSSQFDVSDLVGIEVTGFIAQGSARQVIEQLMAGFYFEACCSDKLYFRRRGRAVADTITFDDLSAGIDNPTDVTFDPVRGNMEELPAQVAVGYANLSADYEAGSEMGDRLVGPGSKVEKVDLPIVLTPAQAKGRALAFVQDAISAGTTGTISLTDDYASLEPTDAIVVPDRSGTIRRMRIVRESYQQTVKTLDIVGDDPSALVTTGLTMDTNTPAIVVRPPLDSESTMLDIPLLLDSYNTPGFMVAVAPAGEGSWLGATVHRSPDGVSYEQASIATSAAIVGVATELGDWDGGEKYDEVNVFTVTVNGELSSSTREAMSANRAINVAAVGVHGRWEIIRYKTATLVGDGQYTLSGLLRGLLGTEWTMGLHAGGDNFVVLNSALRRIEHTVSDIELERFYKTVTLGRTLGTANAESFTDTGVALKPLSPVDARASRSGDNLTLTWRRRTRFQTNYFGPLPAYVPLGEVTELYSIDIIDGSTLYGPITSTAEAVTFDVTDYGLTPGDPVTVKIHQVSASVGRGYELEATV